MLEPRPYAFAKRRAIAVVTPPGMTVRPCTRLGCAFSHYNRGRFAQSQKMFENVPEIRPDDDFAVQWLMRLGQEAR